CNVQQHYLLLEVSYLSLPSHGSNPAYLYDYYNLNKPNQVIDFSVNTNHLGMPNELVNNWSNLLEKVADYPDPHNTNLLERLKKFETAVKTQDAVFFCNPNNPTGKYVKKDQLEKMARICLKYNCLLIVDEAFYDFLIDYDDSIDLHKKYSNLIFLRSLTKIYA